MSNHVKHLKTHYTISFDITHLITAEHCQAQIDGMLALRADPRYEQLPVKHRVFIELAHQAYEKEGVEGFLREAFRFSARESLNSELRDLFPEDGDERVKLAPVKVVYNGLSVGTPE